MSEKLIATGIINQFSFELNDPQRQALLDCLGYDFYKDEEQLRSAMEGAEEDELDEELRLYQRGCEVLNRVEYHLGFYETGIQYLDNMPTDNDIRRTFEALGQSAEDLYGQLVGLNAHGHALLKNKQYDTIGLLQKVGELVSLSDVVVRKPSKDSRGAKGRKSRQVIVDDLVEVFDEYCLLENDLPDHKRRFVGQALDCAQIAAPKNIQKLIDAPNNPQVKLKPYQRRS